MEQLHGRCARVLALSLAAASEPPGPGAALPAWRVQWAREQAPAGVQDGLLCTPEGKAHCEGSGKQSFLALSACSGYAFTRL